MASYKHERDIYSNKHVINTFKMQAQSWVDRYGEVLKDIAMKDLESLRKVIQ